MEGLKAQTLETKKGERGGGGGGWGGGGGGQILGGFEGEQAPFRWKHSRVCSWRAYRVCSWKRKNT